MIRISPQSEVKTAIARLVNDSQFEAFTQWLIDSMDDIGKERRACQIEMRLHQLVGHEQCLFEILNEISKASPRNGTSWTSTNTVTMNS